MSNDVRTLLAQCRELGATFAPCPGGKLKVRAPAPLPDYLQDALKRHKGEILAVLLAERAEATSGRPNYRTLYREMAQDPLFEDFPAVDSWLADHHPAMWRRLRELDDELIRMEREGVPEEAYRAKLGELVSLCQQAKAMRKGSEQEKAKGRSLAPHSCGGARFWLSRYSDLWICEKCTPPPQESAVKRRVEAGEEITEGVCFAQ